jgi:hypothetical protein
MRDRGLIVAGLLVFLALITFPIWSDLAAGVGHEPPELVLPPEGGQCLLDTPTMRVDHMRLLMEWRDEVVRDDDRITTAADGRRYYKSLSGTCMGCHTDKEKFCDRCHDYLAVSPYCWDCHVAPPGEPRWE